MDKEEHEELKRDILNCCCLDESKGLHVLAKSIVYLADTLGKRYTIVKYIEKNADDGTREVHRWW